MLQWYSDLEGGRCVEGRDERGGLARLHIAQGNERHVKNQATGFFARENLAGIEHFCADYSDSSHVTIYLGAKVALLSNAQYMDLRAYLRLFVILQPAFISSQPLKIRATVAL